MRYALRTLLKQPGFTFVALITLTLGIGANAAIFSVVSTVLIRPLPYEQPDRVVLLWSHWTNWAKTWVSEPELADYRKAQSLEHVAAFDYTSFNLTGAGDTVRVRAATVQADVFAALGVHAIAGRLFSTDEDRPGAGHVVVLTEELWRSHFGADRSIPGRTIDLDRTPYTIVGVLPAGVRLPLDYGTRDVAQLWVPLALGPPDPQDRGNHGLNMLARLRPAVTLTQAQAEIDGITRNFVRSNPAIYDSDFGATLFSVPAEVFGSIRPALVVLLLAVGAVLLIACANVANLLLARSEARQKEIAIRSVLGATHGQLVRQLFVESVVLSGAGGAGGVAFAYAATRLLVALDPLKIPRVADVTVDARVVAFTFGLALITALIFGLVPALHASRAALQPALKEGGRSSHVASGWLRRGLVVGEIAGCVALVAAAMLLARSFARLLDVDAGFNPTHVLTFRTSLPQASYPNAASMIAAFEEIGRRLRTANGVLAAGAVTGLPLASTRGDTGIRIEGRPPDGKTPLAADWQVVTPGYFEAIGMSVKAGRTFTDADRADMPPVIIVNDSMAKRFWPGISPVGRRMRTGSEPQSITVVGVVADVHHRGLDSVPRPEMYRPHAQFRYGGAAAPAVSTMTWTVRTAGDPRAAAGEARAAVRAVDAGLGISDVATLEAVVSDSTSDRRLNLLLFVVLAALALALATVGVYGVVAYSVTQRTHEIGVRIAIGAQRADIMRMVLGEGIRLAVAGVAIGSTLTLASARLLRGLLFEVSATDPLTFATVAAALVAAAVTASYIPARRAIGVDPMIAMRGE